MIILSSVILILGTQQNYPERFLKPYQRVGPSPRPIKSESLGMKPRQQCFDKAPRFYSVLLGSRV